MRIKKILAAALALSLLLAPMVRAAGIGSPAFPQMDDFFEGLARVKQDGKYGFADSSGEIVIPCTFDDAFPFKGGVACVVVDDLWGFIDATGAYFVEPKYAFISISSYLTSDVIPYYPRHVVYFENGPLAVREAHGQKYGLLAESGTELLPLVYDGVYQDDAGLYHVLEGERWFTVNSRGETVGPYPQGYTAVRHSGAADLWFAGRGGKLALVDDTGQPVSDMIFDDFGPFTGEAFPARQGEKWGFVGIDGTELTPPVYDTVLCAFLWDIITVTLDARDAMVDARGNLLTSERYDDLLPQVYTPFVKAFRDGKQGLLAADGSVTIPLIYDRIEGDDASGLYRAYLGEQVGLVADTGEIVAPVQYEDVAGPVDGVLALQENGRWLLQDSAGQRTELPYAGVRVAGAGLFQVAQNGRLGCIDTTGKVVIPLVYGTQGPIRFEDGLAFPYQNGKKGAIDTTGTVIFPFVYDTLTTMNTPSQIMATQNGERIYLTRPQDVPSSWALEGAQRALSRWLIPPMMQGDYRRAITRQEFCALVAQTLRMEGLRKDITDGFAAAFEDADDPDILLLAELGIARGLGDGRFGPDNRITREAAAVLLKNYMDYLGFPAMDGAIDYADSMDISHWAADAVRDVSLAGIMTGVGDNLFGPKGHYTREQAVMTVLRIFETAVGT